MGGQEQMAFGGQEQMAFGGQETIYMNLEEEQVRI